VNTIIDTVKDAIDETPPEIIADLMDVGVCLLVVAAYYRV